MRTRSSSFVAVLVAGAGIVSAAGMFSNAGAVGVVVAVGGAAAQTPALERVGSVPVAAPVNALAAGDGHLFVGTGSTLHVIDVSRPASPEPVGAYDFEQPVLALTAVGDTVYVANSHDGLRRLDVSDPSAPALTGTSATRGQAVGVATAGSLVFVSDNSLGFDIVDGAGDVQRVGEYLSDGFPRGIAAAGSHALVADQPAGLLVVDVSDSAAPAVIGNLSFGRDPITQVFAPDARSSGDASPTVAAIVSGGGGLQAVDISDPSAPVVTASVPRVDRPAGAAMWGRLVYAASADAIEVFDLTVAGRPALVAQSDLGGRAGAVAVNEDLVFVATPDEVVIFRRTE